MVQTILRMPEELHQKLRWLSYKENRSQNTIMVEILEKALKEVEIPKGVGE